MRPLITIRNVLAGFFLLLFALSITPKRTLHNLVANHKDGGGFSTKNPFQTQLDKATFNCQCDNFVAESPFISDDTIGDSICLAFASEYQYPSGYHYISSGAFCFGLRGPPTV